MAGTIEEVISMSREKLPVGVIVTEGTNCAKEMIHSFNNAGGEARPVLMTDLRENPALFRQFKAIGLPGGFTYGDYMRSGKLLAIEIVEFLRDEFHNFVDRDKGIGLGICNGFQTLVRAGIIPRNEIGNMTATLQNNDSGHFQCDSVHVKFEKESACVFLEGFDGMMQLPIAHGEGKFNASDPELGFIEKNGLIVARYTYPTGERAYGVDEWNPNGSALDIAAATDISGHWLGSMPHFERDHDEFRNPNWRRPEQLGLQGQEIFNRMVQYFE